MRFFLFAFIFASLLAWQSARAQYALSGNVLAPNDAPIEGVFVRLEGRTRGQITDISGAFRFENLRAGRYELIVESAGYKTYRRDIELAGDQRLRFTLLPDESFTEEVLVEATRANEQTATTYSTLTEAEIEDRNFGQDIPVLLDQLPATVAASDAGAGIGYTYLRIRGSDNTRTNVTINGIPLNDPESHGVFWVNLPDLASSAQSIQVQRGVGTSTNGAAAFGASINVQTGTLQATPHAELDQTVGSFNTLKTTVSAGTGLIRDRFALDLRLSRISTDGFVDRARVDLRSANLTAGYYGDRTIAKAVILLGREETYQSWYGLPESKLETDRTFNFYTYEDEVDNYGQDHYQFLLAHEVNAQLSLNAALHYTRGAGYFEQYRESDEFKNYPVFGRSSLIVEGDTLTTTDLIRRRWLDNHFYGFTFSGNYRINDDWELTVGGAGNQYDGDHYGRIIWSRYAPDIEIREPYYFSRGLKTEGNVYTKLIGQITTRLSGYADLQFRYIDYRIGDEDLETIGRDNDQQPILGAFTYEFFNPKFGLTYALTERQQLYASYGIAQREPIRSDFVDNPEMPRAEWLGNLEAGYRVRTANWRFAANAYWMDYRDQLVLTGALNDVGAAIRTNVEDSYRAGIELEAEGTLAPGLSLYATAALSQNKIAEFNEVIYQYDEAFNFLGTRTVTYSNTDIAFSPNAIASATLTWQPTSWLSVSGLGKYVGRQYLDNTQNAARSLDPFFVTDLRAFVKFQPRGTGEVELGLLVNNVLDLAYEPNGYTFNYEVADELVVENFYYPQAGRNFLVRLRVALE